MQDCLFALNFSRKDVYDMKKFASLVFSLALCACLAIPAAADAYSNQGGNYGGNPNAPQTGSTTVAMLAVTACAAGGIGTIAYKKSKE